MSLSVLSQLALDDVVDGSSPDLTSIPHSRASKTPRPNQYWRVNVQGSTARDECSNSGAFGLWGVVNARAV
jgi:hypothetical protein